jgi:hypothetical protein
MPPARLDGFTGIDPRRPEGGPQAEERASQQREHRCEGQHAEIDVNERCA